MHSRRSLAHEGRLQTLSSSLEFRKFIFGEDKATKRPRNVYARYIYGISKPGKERVQQIKDALHEFGKELLSA